MLLSQKFRKQGKLNDPPKFTLAKRFCGNFFHFGNYLVIFIFVLFNFILKIFKPPKFKPVPKFYQFKKAVLKLSFTKTVFGPFFFGYC